jgi:uncharacterized Rossmann fold enzyme
VDTSEIVANAVENMQLMTKNNWLQKCAINDETAWIVSAGPSLDRLLTNGFLRPEWFANGNTKHKLFTVKHALPTLAKHGFAPHFCVVLDPRPISGVSTHGHLREGLYAKAPKSTKFLVASMTHPSVTSYLIKNGYDITGWHSAANGLVGTKENPSPLVGVSTFIQGGTCSATRSISLAHYMGFRKVHLVGFDNNLAGKPSDFDATEDIDGKQIRKYWPTRIGDSKEFWTTGELIAQIQDLEQFLNDQVADLEIRIVGADKGTSLVGALNETIVNRTIMKHYTAQTGEFKTLG